MNVPNSNVNDNGNANLNRNNADNDNNGRVLVRCRSVQNVILNVSEESCLFDTEITDPSTALRMTWGRVALG